MQTGLIVILREEIPPEGIQSPHLTDVEGLVRMIGPYPMMLVGETPSDPPPPQAKSDGQQKSQHQKPTETLPVAHAGFRAITSREIPNGISQVPENASSRENSRNRRRFNQEGTRLMSDFMREGSFLPKRRTPQTGWRTAFRS
jgi:hypothetical protein